MRWVRVTCARVQPANGVYQDWKAQIAQECSGRCVYCAIPEADFGGLVNFHIDHFRPKSRAEFAPLINDIRNLYLACAVCNRFKSDDWPGEPDAQGSTATYLDPSVIDFNQHVAVRTDHLVDGTTVAGRYMIERLYLNRAQLVLARRASNVATLLAAFGDYFSGIKDELAALQTPEANALLLELVNCLAATVKLQAQLSVARPYAPGDTSRPRVAKAVKSRRSIARRRR